MASYKIFFKRNAEKELRKVPSSHLANLMAKIYVLSSQPRPSGVQMLKGVERYFRLRQGDYRVVYEIDDTRHEVTVIKIGHRREVYD